jgi:hypothetical protein
VRITAAVTESTSAPFALQELETSAQSRAGIVTRGLVDR